MRDDERLVDPVDELVALPLELVKVVDQQLEVLVHLACPWPRQRLLPSKHPGDSDRVHGI